MTVEHLRKNTIMQKSKTNKVITIIIILLLTQIELLRNGNYKYLKRIVIQ
jgi:hypothetical protein